MYIQNKQANFPLCKTNLSVTTGQFNRVKGQNRKYFRNVGETMAPVSQGKSVSDVLTFKTADKNVFFI